MEILTPTFLEYWAARRKLPHAHIHWTGVRLARWTGVQPGSAVILCGLAGALAPDLPPGTVLIPTSVGLADSSIIPCDRALVDALLTAAHALHFQPHTGPLLTAPSLILGSDRLHWSQRGFIAADMETGLLAVQNLRLATIRVVLDSPEHSISPAWLHPTTALLQPSLWRELFWLSHAAPRFALRAASILKLALTMLPSTVTGSPIGAPSSHPAVGGTEVGREPSWSPSIPSQSNHTNSTSLRKEQTP